MSYLPNQMEPTGRGGSSSVASRPSLNVGLHPLDATAARLLGRTAPTWWASVWEQFIPSNQGES